MSTKVFSGPEAATDAAADGSTAGTTVERKARPTKAPQRKPRVIDLRSTDSDREAAADDAIDTLMRRPRSRRSAAPHDVASGGRAAISEARLEEEMGRELHRASIARRPGVLAAVTVAEGAQLTRRLGSHSSDALARMFDGLFAEAPLLEQHGARDGGGFYLLMPETDLITGRARLRQLSAALARSALTVDGETVRITPIAGFVEFEGAPTSAALRERAEAALSVAELHLDLIPVAYTPAMAGVGAVSGTGSRRLTTILDRTRSALQIGFTTALLVLLPFLVYATAWHWRVDLSTITYPLVAAALAGTALSLWLESIRAVAPVALPDLAPGPYPTASAIVAAYLPNEAATIEATLRAMLDQEYPGEMQIILAYNTPRPLPVEAVLADLAARDPRLLLLRVAGSTSKAQNVNAALAHVRGEFVGVFDADHHPAAGSFLRAWRWIATGSDIVQGHCVVRNGEASWISRVVAVEFETVYAVSHPGRARLHGFGIFGGSNGYWRTERLREIRMHGSMLTEDIDSSMRSLLGGLKIVSDPGLISTELAPTTLAALWNQRLRWAQGWTQTSRRHLRPALASPTLSLRQKTGAAFLLGWTQVVPWVTIQVLPILAFGAWRDRNLSSVDLLVPLFVLLTVFTFSVGPAQAVFGYALGDDQIRQHRKWFWMYALHSALWYGELKNLIARVAQVKELTGERQWRVTPRGVPAPSAATGVVTVRASGPDG